MTLAPLEVEVSPELAAILDLGLLAAEGLRVTPAGGAIERALAAAGAEQRAAYGAASPGDIPGVAAVRRLFAALGIDPTKTRPSSEALLRRVLKGQGISPVNNVVDTINLCSLQWLLPMGLYDLAELRGNLRLKLGGPGAGYPGLGKAWVNLEGRPALHDELGPFGAPTSDSFRTRVHNGTTQILLVVFAPRDESGTDPDLLARCLAGTRTALIELCGLAPEAILVRRVR
jgi:DNA/RNA-binding domain of Phe-tRNA-synthetase-like protein